MTPERRHRIIVNLARAIEARTDSIALDLQDEDVHTAFSTARAIMLRILERMPPEEADRIIARLPEDLREILALYRKSQPGEHKQ
jgi:uncharacterized protein (DUF2267 family)